MITEILACICTVLLLCFKAFPKALRQEAFKEGWGHKCCVCNHHWDKGWMIEFDHINPAFDRGPNSKSNMRAYCRFCHFWRHADDAAYYRNVGDIRRANAHGAGARLILKRILENGPMRFGHEKAGILETTIFLAEVEKKREELRSKPILIEWPSRTYSEVRR